MSRLKTLWQLVGGFPLPDEEDGPARRTQIVLTATAASAVLSALFGLALASGDPAHMARNLYQMPLVILLTSVFSLPAALLAWRVSGAERPPSDLAIGLAAGTLTGTTLLAALAPLVALYSHTSEWMGPVLALAAASAGALGGTVITWRAVLLRAPKGGAMKAVFPLAVLAFVHMLTLSQMIAISDFMPEQTFLDNGVEGVHLLGRR